MVAKLQKDKIKLQNLVIAQKAVIDIEKENNNKAQAVVQNAIANMRKAKGGASVAMRVARSERSERLRLEADNATIRRQLESDLPAEYIKEPAEH